MTHSFRQRPLSGHSLSPAFRGASIVHTLENCAHSFLDAGARNKGLPQDVQIGVSVAFYPPPPRADRRGRAWRTFAKLAAYVRERLAESRSIALEQVAQLICVRDNPFLVRLQEASQLFNRRGGGPDAAKAAAKLSAPRSVPQAPFQQLPTFPALPLRSSIHDSKGSNEKRPSSRNATAHARAAIKQLIGERSSISRRLTHLIFCPKQNQ